MLQLQLSIYNPMHNMLPNTGPSMQMAPAHPQPVAQAQSSPQLNHPHFPMNVDNTHSNM